MEIIKKIVLLIIITTMIISAFPGCDLITSTCKLSSSCVPADSGTIVPANSSYEKGLVVNVKAAANDGYRFDHWEGGVSGTSANVQITMDKPKNLIAYFKKTYAISATSSPNNGGTISPASGNYDEGSTVTLVATPAPYYVFSGWSGDSSDTSNRTTVNMNSDKNMFANFTKQTYSLQTQTNLQGGGSVEPQNGSFEALAPINLTATPASGYRFDGWTGSEISSSNPLSVIMNTNRSITANFVKICSLALSSSPIEGGTINAKPGSYDAGTKVDLSVTPSFPYYPVSWKGTDDDSVFPTTVTMNNNTSVTAFFAKSTQLPAKTTSGGIMAGTSKASPVATVQIQLNQYDWLQGGIVFTSQSSIAPTTAFIQDPTGKTIKDLGRFTQTTFSFMAEISGTYTVVFQNQSWYWANYSINYTIWGK